MAKCEKCGIDDQLRHDYGHVLRRLNEMGTDAISDSSRFRATERKVIDLQKELIERNQQLIEAQEKLLHPLVEVDPLLEVALRSSAARKWRLYWCS